MILPDYELKQWIVNGGIAGSDHYEINPASVDLSFSGRFKRQINPDTDVWNLWRSLLHQPGEAIKAERIQAFIKGRRQWTGTLEADKFVIFPDEVVLVDTNEVLTIPDNLAGLLQLKSSIGRMGLNHLHSGWFDPGFCGTATLELHNVGLWPQVLERNQRIIQFILIRLTSPPERAYWQTGRYQGQQGPTEAR